VVAWLVALGVVVALVVMLRLVLGDVPRPQRSILGRRTRQRGVDGEAPHASDDARLILHTHGSAPVHDHSFDKPR
jgi:hypothetical protein